MPEKDKVFANKIKYKGVFNFSEFYRFCYDWLVNEAGLLVPDKEVVVE